MSNVPQFQTGGPASRSRPFTAGALWEVLRVSLYLGLTSFGGPIAHLGYFERTYVRQRGWLSAEEYGGFVALSQILPGPASSKLGFLIGMHRAGWLGGVAAWIGFTLPSALLLFACAVFAARLQGPWMDAGLHGLKLLAVAVVAQAVWSMARRFCTTWATAGLALAGIALLFAVGGAPAQITAIAVGAIGGVVFRCGGPTALKMNVSALSPRTGWIAVALFLVLLTGLPLAAAKSPEGYLAFAEIFYRTGALVFGGGHVVLPLLHDALVPAGWVSEDRFLAGYGLAQAVPGPLFTFAAYLGADAAHLASPVGGALIGLIFIFLPGMLIAVAGVSLWHRLGDRRTTRAALAGINAAVVGILGAAFIDPVCSSAVDGVADFAIAASGLLLLEKWKVSPVAVLLSCVSAAEALSFYR